MHEMNTFIAKGLFMARTLHLQEQQLARLEKLIELGGAESQDRFDRNRRAV